MTPSSQPGEIITFYSFKGGTGRTMALANVAAVLAKKNSQTKVLVIDWDIEAPGLHRFFDRVLDPQTSQRIQAGAQLGLLDLFADIRSTLADRGSPEREPGSDEEGDEFFAALDLGRFIVHINEPPLDLLPAGAFGTSYSSRAQMFDWASLYTLAPWLYSAFAGFLSRRYQYVLIDSRTGVSDITGVCTALLPDKLVIVFTPNRQSTIGAVDVVRRSAEYRKESGDLRPLSVYPLPSRIETAEPRLRESWRHGDETAAIPGYQPLFEDLLKGIYDLPECKLETYFDEIQVQYIPRYSYGEEVAVLDERTSDRLSLTRSYEAFAARLTAPATLWDEPSSQQDASSVIDSGPKGEAAPLLFEALERYRRAGDIAGEASVHRRLGDLLFRFGDLAQSTANYEQARNLFQKLGDRHGEATVLKSLGDASKKQGGLPGAAQSYQAALDLYKAVGARREMGEVWRSVADLQQGAGDLKAALQSYSEAIAAAASTADVRGRAMAELGAGEVASLLGDDASAARSFDRAAPLFNQLTDHRRALTAWQRSFSAWMNLRHVNDANSRFRQAANVQGGALVSKEWKGEALVAMADQLLREARYSEALAIYMEAEVVYADGPPDRLAAVLRSLGDVQVELSRPDNAKVNYKKALEIYRSSADDLGQATVLERLGMLASSVE